MFDRLRGNSQVAPSIISTQLGNICFSLCELVFYANDLLELSRSNQKIIASNFPIEIVQHRLKYMTMSKLKRIFSSKFKMYNRKFFRPCS